MSVLLHISDPHFGTERPAVLAALLRLAEHCAPRLIVLSGDITQRARRSQFAAAHRFVEQLPAPVLAIPGNHDIPLFDLWHRWRAPYAHYCEAFGPGLEPEWESAEWLVLGLNTTRWWRHKNGEVSTSQMTRIASRLRAASAAQVRVVVTHQPLAVTRPEDEANLLRGHAMAVHLWGEAGADLVLGGHIHLPFVQPLRPAPSHRPLWAVQAGTAVSSRVRGGIPNSVNLIRRDDALRRCRVEQWDYVADADAFACRQTQVLDLG